jgi:signal transduction histidine kinase
LVAPQSVNFRYRLDGIDRTWREAGTRRQAFYENLPPGNYGFHVIASNNDGLWNEVGDSFTLEIRPAVYQTTWFRALSVLALLSCIWLFITARIRKATQVIQSRLAERIRERERIARELHDTLLQGFHGLMLRFQVAAKLTPDAQPAHPILNDALDRADVLMTESRERIRNLRYEAENVIPLPEAFASLGDELNNIAPLHFKVTVAGTSREIVPLIRDEVYFIGREALVNAFTHSHGSTVELDIDFEESDLRVRVRDDGRGLSDKVLRSKGSEGHWGLSGMHERAENIGSRLNIWNRVGSGCEVELKVPGNLAYKRTPLAPRWHRLRSLVAFLPSGS